MANKVKPQKENALDSKDVSDNKQKEEATRLDNSEQQMQEPLPKTEETKETPGKLRQICACPPQGCLASLVTNVATVVLFWAVTWTLSGDESLPGRNIFGLIFIYSFSVLGGKLMVLIKIPNLPPLPRLLGMLLSGFLIRNIPFTNEIVKIDVKWGSALRNIALSIILALAGLGLNPEALNKLKAVCFRLSLGPCIIESCSAAVISHFLLGLPWEWGFMFGFVLGAVSPAVVVLSMLGLQARGYGVDKGIPTLLIAAGSLDDIVAITGFNTFLGMAFSTGSTFKSLLHGLMEVAIGAGAGILLGTFICFFPSRDEIHLAWKRTFFIMGLAMFSLLGSRYFDIHGSGGLCTVVLAFLAGIAWAEQKNAVEELVAIAWSIFQPFLFGLIGAEISVVSLNPKMVGCNWFCCLRYSTTTQRCNTRTIWPEHLDSSFPGNLAHSSNWSSYNWPGRPQASPPDSSRQCRCEKNTKYNSFTSIEKYQ
ncbi:sodium/hydrogen exchanger 9B2-like isoform X2 [Sceloporus undulatus]|uniref:sodium/hydrogen exchanger 9B2-like isoform X2 n=1 Tax=Sceloporus undulatus TaxID=8520 RepID=UPI001C4AF086|nr:sodium/hydrogen exchanger 9B2-like isoform X2 [Sceloporus undulatus]